MKWDKFTRVKLGFDLRRLHWMRLSKPIRIPLCVIIYIVLVSIGSRSFAAENNRKVFRQFNAVISSLPQSESKQRIDQSLQKLYSALKALKGQVENKSTRDLMSGVIKFFLAGSPHEKGEIQALLRRWDQYLYDATSFSGSAYRVAMESQQRDCSNSLVRLERKMEEAKLKQKKHSSQWVSELSNRFGKNFLKENKKEIAINFLVIMNSEYRPYEPEIKDLIYQELMLYGSYREYFGKFLEFCKDRLDSNGQKLLSSRIEAAEAILSLVKELSFSEMFETYVLQEKMAIRQAQEQNMALYEFFQDALKTYGIDVTKASEDIEKVNSSEK